MYYFIDKTPYIPIIQEFNNENDALTLLYNSIESKEIYVVYKKVIIESIYIKQNNDIYKINGENIKTKVTYKFLKQISYEFKDNKQNIPRTVPNSVKKDQMSIVFDELKDQQVEIVESENDLIKKQLKEQSAEILKLYNEEIEKYKKIEQRVKKQDEQEKYEKIRHLCHLIDDYKLYKQLKKDKVTDIAIFFIAKYNYFENSTNEFKEKLDCIETEKFENCAFETINTELINMALEYYNEMKQIKIEIDHSYKELEID